MDAVTLARPSGIRTSHVLHPADVVDDEVLHPGAVVLQAEPPLAPSETRRFREAATRAAMVHHPAGRARHLRLV